MIKTFDNYIKERNEKTFRENIHIKTGRRTFIYVDKQINGKNNIQHRFHSEIFKDLDGGNVRIIFDKIIRTKTYYHIYFQDIESGYVDELYSVKNDNIKCLYNVLKYANDIINEDEINTMIDKIKSYDVYL